MINLYKIDRYSNFQPREIGLKGFNLQIITKLGIRIPKTFVIPISEINYSAINNLRINKSELNTRKRYAIRSSGIDEDSIHSHAGIFDSYLDISYAELDIYVSKVINSFSSSVATSYRSARDISFKKGAVIIQEMIYPIISGIYFNFDPVKKYENAFIFELVKGNSFKLNQGLIIPTRIEFEKQTGLISSYNLNTASDNSIINYFLSNILKKAIQIFKQVEHNYKNDLQIEWGYSKNLYLFQVREMSKIAQAINS